MPSYLKPLPQTSLLLLLTTLLTVHPTSSSISQNSPNHQNPTITSALAAISDCQENCAVCSPPAFTACQQCMIGYVLERTGRCVACPTGCQICVGEQTCSRCRSGYASTNQVTMSRCVACSQGCQKCYFLQITSGFTMQLTSCETCLPGYYLTNLTNSSIQTCEPCITACHLCVDTNSCFQCVAGFGYNPTTNQCYVCQPNCNACAPQSGCFSCATGFRNALINNVNECVPCLKNCQRCLTQNTCSLCFKGYYPYNTTTPQSQTPTSQCIPCPNQCIKCYNQKICLSCSSGYFLNVNQYNQYNTTTNQTTPVIVSATCQPCPANCVACVQGGTCSRCQSGYYVGVGGLCGICGVACHQCLGSGQCVSCMGSYYLSNGHCKPCNQPCTSCHITQQQIYCTGCISLYYTPSNGQCLSCTSLSPGCSTCDNTTNCLTCADGYNLHEGQCYLKHELGAAYIVMMCIAGIIGLIAIGFGIWACWRHRNGYGFMNGDSDNPGVRASYYQIP